LALLLCVASMASICRVIFTTSADASTGTVTRASRALDVFDDPRGVVTDEGKQAAFVARHEIICLASFRQGQQEIVCSRLFAISTLERKPFVLNRCRYPLRRLCRVSITWSKRWAA